MLHENPLAPKQIDFIAGATKKWNIAHGAVRSGKTVGSIYAFMHACWKCPDSKIFMVGHSSDTIYQNVIRLLLEDERFAIFRPFCAWFPGKRQLKFRDKTIQTLGAKDEGAIGQFQGKTMSLCYCDEMTLYPESIIDMIDTRLSLPYSMGFATMNPASPNHKIKEWIDKAAAGDPNYYALHFTLDDNPFLDSSYKQRIRDSLSGVFYKRNYLGMWCLAEGAIYDFFDKSIHVLKSAPAAADYFIGAIDYGISNAFAALVIGVSTGQYTQTGRRLWVEKEYYWDCIKRERQKINSEFADDMVEFFECYGPRSIYIDPSALAMKLELQRRGLHVTEANNDVLYGIEQVSREMGCGNLYILDECKNLIREIEGYIWDKKKSEQGMEAPVKKADHAADCLRYAIATHKVNVYDPYKQKKDRDEWLNNRFDPGPRRF